MICKDCRKETPASGFYDSNKGKCKECVKARVRQHRAANIEIVRAYDRERGQLPHRRADRAARAWKYKEKHELAIRRNRQENPEKYRARNAVNNAVRDGKLQVKPCERCGDGVGVQAHHDDYSKPLDVMWLCPKHHGERHRELNEIRRRSAA